MSKIIVAGSIITDMSVKVNSHPKIGETIIGKDLTYSIGGKGANQAIAASRLGCEVVMIGKVGDDKYGEEAHKFLNTEGISCIINKSKLATGIAMIVVDENTGDNNIVVIPGANMDLMPGCINLDSVKYDKGDVLISQFEIPSDTVKQFFEKGKEIGTINILNPAPASMITNDIMSLVDVLIVNETELEIITGNDSLEINEELIENIRYASTKLSYKPPIVIVTLGKYGVVCIMGTDTIFIEGHEVSVLDTTGAGDCFVGSFASVLCKHTLLSQNTLSKEVIKKAMKFANKAASLSVQKQGSGISMPTLKEVIDN